MGWAGEMAEGMKDGFLGENWEWKRKLEVQSGKRERKQGVEKKILRMEVGFVMLNIPTHILQNLLLNDILQIL